VAGQYAVEVQKLAASQALASAAFPPATQAFTTGHLVLQKGAWSGNSFTAAAGSPPVTITIDATNNTLAGIRDAINAANAGVSAALVNDGTGTRLTLLSKDTGAANAFRITTTDSNGADTTGNAPVAGGGVPGLWQLAYDPSAAGGPVTNLTQTRAAQDAVVVVNGLTITSAANQITGAIDGVTLNLKKDAVGVINTLTLARDTGSVRAAIDAFVKAYNDFNATARQLTSYDPNTKSAGPLNGDSTVRGARSLLAAALSTALGPTSAGGLQTLSDIGISVQKDGSLQVDSAKFQAAASDLSKLALFFTAKGSGASPDGLGARLKSLTDALVGTDGLIPAHTQGLQTQINALKKQEDAWQVRLTATQKRLIAQYSALDAQLQQMQNLSNSLTNSLAQLATTAPTGK